MTFEGDDFGLQIGIGAIGKAFGSAVAFVGSIVLARAIGDTGYGAFTMLLSISMFLDNPFTGWFVACRKRMTEVSFSTDRAAGAVYLGCITGTIAIIVITVCVDLFYGTFRGVDVRMLAVVMPGTLFYTGTKDILNGTTNFGLNPWLESVREVLRVALQIGLVWLIEDVAGMILGLTAASLLIVPIILRFSGVRPALPTTEDLADIARFAKSSVPTGFVSSALSQIDIIVLGGLAGTAIVGNYRVAMNLLFPATFIVAAMSPGMMSRVSSLDSRNENPSKPVTKGLTYASMIALPMAAGAIVIGDLVAVTIYSSEFERAGLFMGWLSIYYVFKTQMNILTSTLSGLDRPDLVLKLSTVGFVINAVLGVYLFYIFSSIGVVYATVIGIASRYLLGALWMRRTLSVNLTPRPLIHQIGAATLMGGLLITFRSALDLDSWIAVIGTVGLGAVLYSVTLLLVSKEIRQTARAITRDGFNSLSGS
jgi:O-antigen/teichoic acid export membrane protein